MLNLAINNEAIQVVRPIPLLTNNLIYKRYDVMVETSITKICPKCKVEKPVDDFHKDKSRKDGLRPICKKCVREYQQTHKVMISARMKGHYQANRIKMDARHKEYCQDHKSEIKTWKKQYYQDNQIEISIHHKKYYQDHRDKIVAYRQAHKAEIASSNRAYRQTLKGKAVIKKIKQKRRARKMGADHENFNPNEIFERDGYICQLCGKKTRPDYKNPYHSLYPNLDHIIPLSKGGAHTKRNAQCLCRKCNMIKHNSGEGNQFRLFG